MGKQKRYVSGKDFKDMKQTVDDENDAELQHEKDVDKPKPIMSKIKKHLTMKQKMKDYNASDKSMDAPDGSDARDESKRKKKWAKQKKKGGSSMNEKRDSSGRWTT